MTSGISISGNSITIANCTITFNNAFDQTTGVATITITPSGGLGTLPAILQGQPGPSPLWRNVNLTEIAYGALAPSPPASVTQISPGGPGAPAIYDLNIALHAGQPGLVGSFLIAAAQDLLGTAAHNNTIVWNEITGIFNYMPLLVPTYFWASSFNSISGNPTGAQVLSQVTVPAQKSAWYPICFAGATVNGTVNTQVNLSANIGSTAGNLVASDYGVAGVPSQRLRLAPGPPAGSAASYPQIASGTSATIVLSATQVGSTTDNWAIPGATGSFAVLASPILS